MVLGREISTEARGLVVIFTGSAEVEGRGRGEGGGERVAGARPLTVGPWRGAEG